MTGKVLDKADIAVHLHLYYEDLMEEFCNYLACIPQAFDLYISCRNQEVIESIEYYAKKISNVNKLTIRPSENRGRDIAPFYVLFNKELQRYDYLLHIHSKKSIFTGEEKRSWRRDALEGVLKDSRNVERILSLFEEENKKAGIICGELTKSLPIAALHWLSNEKKSRELLSRLGINFQNGMLFYPVGSFFWVKREAIQSLFDLKLSYVDFDEECGQIDGTLAHSLERVIATVCRNNGFHLYIYNSLTDEFDKDVCYRAFEDYIEMDLDRLSRYIANKFDVVSFDIFDTLITRRIYNHDDLFIILEKKTRSEWGITDFYKIRKEAEEIAILKKGDYCNIKDIYEVVPEISNISATTAGRIMSQELELEFNLCIPRKDTVVLLNRLKEVGKKIVLVSDTYLPCSFIEKVLDKCGISRYDETMISCDIGKRKDSNGLWDYFFNKYGKSKTIHLGDNPYSDYQKVSDRKREAYLLMSPRDIFAFSAYYEKFRQFDDTSIENSMILGIMVNEIMFNSPFSMKTNGKVSFDSLYEYCVDIETKCNNKKKKLESENGWKYNEIHKCSDICEAEIKGKFCVDSITVDRGVNILGWSFVDDIKNMKNCKRNLLFKDIYGNLLASTIDELPRQDVADTFGNGKDYFYSGFAVTLDNEALKIDAVPYQLGMLTEFNNEKYLTWEEKFYCANSDSDNNEIHCKAKFIDNFTIHNNSRDNDLNYNIDNAIVSDEDIDIFGWVFYGIPEHYMYKLKIILADQIHSYEIEHKRVERLDVANEYPELHFLVMTGFKSKVPKNDLLKGKYKLILRLENSYNSEDVVDIVTNYEIEV